MGVKGLRVTKFVQNIKFEVFGARQKQETVSRYNHSRNISDKL